MRCIAGTFLWYRPGVTPRSGRGTRLRRAVASPASALVLAMLMSPTARASDAQELFDKGLADMKAGNYESGCPALEESFRQDPQPGALFTLATCESRRGRLATGMKHFEAS